MSGAEEPRRRPRAVRLDPVAPAAPEPQAAPARPAERLRAPEMSVAPAPPPVAFTPDPFAVEASDEPAAERAVEAAQRQGIGGRARLSWGSLFWSALGGLVSLAVGLWITGLVEDAFARSRVLGIIGLVLAALAALALIAMGAREAVAIGRQRHIVRLHAGFAKAHATDDGTAARQLLPELTAIYAARAETARARTELLALREAIVDGCDLVEIAERTLMAPLDARARGAIAAAARRVSAVTTMAPRAIIDVVFVLLQAVRLIRTVAEIYGGRPGLLGFLKLARSVGAHLAITGGMAAGDTLLSGAVGHGIAAKLSTRLGEGMLNGLLTARIGLSAMAVCRPMPYAAEPLPTLRRVVPFMFRSASGDPPET